MRKRDYSLKLRLSQEELSIIRLLSSDYGGATLAETIRMCVRSRYEKVFPPYRRKVGEVMISAAMAGQVVIPDEAMTDEQFCESRGGEIGKDSSGGRICVLTGGGTMVKIPITNRASIESWAKQLRDVKDL